MHLCLLLWSALPQSTVLLHCMFVFLQSNPLKLIRSHPPLPPPLGAKMFKSPDMAINAGGFWCPNWQSSSSHVFILIMLSFFGIFPGPQEGMICATTCAFVPIVGDPREGSGYVATLILPYHGDPREGGGDVAMLVLPHYGDPKTPGGATTTGPDATQPPAICQNSGGAVGGGGSSRGSGGGSSRGSGSCQGSGGGGGGQGSGGSPAKGEGGGGVRVRVKVTELVEPVLVL